MKEILTLLVILLTLALTNLVLERHDSNDRGRDYCRSVYSAIHKPDYDTRTQSCTIEVAEGVRISVVRIHDGKIAVPADIPVVKAAPKFE